MTVSPWVEVQLAVGGALRLAIGDRRGLGFFDVSLDGFWRSFRAAAICYPMYLFLLATRLTSAQWEAAGWPTVLLVETIAYVIAWVAFPLLMLHVAHWLGRDHRFLAFMVAYNWSQVPQTVLLTIIGFDAATGLFPPQIVQFAEAIATIAVLVYEWYIARVALAVSGPQAALVVVIDVVLGTTLGRVAQGLH
jgi:hypothetical protein